MSNVHGFAFSLRNLFFYDLTKTGILTCDRILGPRDHDMSQRQTLNRLSHPDATAGVTFLGQSTLMALEAVVCNAGRCTQGPNLYVYPMQRTHQLVSVFQMDQTDERTILGWETR